jgi:hypothetical protein
MRPFTRLLLGVAANVLLVLAGVLAARVIVGAFGNVQFAGLTTQVMRSTAILVWKLGLGSIVTPYRGMLEFNAGAMLAAVVVCEWVMTFSRRFVR